MTVGKAASTGYSVKGGQGSIGGLRGVDAFYVQCMGHATDAARPCKRKSSIRKHSAGVFLKSVISPLHARPTCVVKAGWMRLCVWRCHGILVV